MAVVPVGDTSDECGEDAAEIAETTATGDRVTG